MSATALPLPLELTKPVTLASDLDTQLRESLGVGKYDPKMQVSMWASGGTTSNQESESTVVDVNGSIVLDANQDIQVDDNDFN
jgi:hypothetical protein